MKKVEKMDMDLKETMKIVAQMDAKLNKCTVLHNDFAEEEIAMNVRYVSKIEGLKIIGDSGASLLILSNN